MKHFILITLTIFITTIITAQDCFSPTAYTELDINNIKAGIMNGGDMWWDGVGYAQYEYPKGSGNNLGFMNSIWLSGIDNTGSLKIAAQKYRTDGFDFWPGPLDSTNPTIQNIECSKFDRFFEIYKTDVQNHIDNIDSLGLPLLTSSIETNVKEWPGIGNKYLLNTYDIDILYDLAPFEDMNGNEIYDPENGDYPLIKGDQCIFWVINDVGNNHSNSGGEAIGVEVQCMAYSYITNDVVNNSTFYDYKIIKRTNGNLHDFYFSQTLDPDIGASYDDYIGCDTSKNYAFAYNFYDGSSYPEPIFINQFINSNLSSFMYYNNGGSATYKTIAPDTSIEYRRFQLALWKDSSALTYGGLGLDTTNPVTKHVYPGNPSSSTEWSECSINSLGSDKRFVMTSGPYNLIQNTPLEITTASITVSPGNTTTCFDINVEITPYLEIVATFLDTVNDNPYNNVSITNNQEDKTVELFPNPASNKINIKVDENFKLTNIEIYDLKGIKKEFTLISNSIDLKGFAKGIYTLKMYSEKANKILIKKFIVE